MAYKQFNPNPFGALVDDCTVRAICAATGESWESVFCGLCAEGLRLGDMTSSKRVWGSYLKGRGYTRRFLPDTCPDCYTVSDFARDHPTGIYILATDVHVICVKDGDWMDSADSGGSVPMMYWTKGKEEEQ